MGYFTRRSFVKVGSFSTFGFFGLGDALRMQAQSPAPARREISIIHLWLTGGVSQLDTWDPKPDVDSRYRSQFESIETKAKGIRICGQLPKTAAPVYNQAGRLPQRWRGAARSRNTRTTPSGSA